MLCRTFSPLLSLLTALGLGGFSWSALAAEEGVDMAMERHATAAEWQSSSFILQFNKPAAAQISYPFLEQLRGIMLRSLNSPDQARDLVNMHNALGTKALSSYAKYVGPQKISVNPKNGEEIRRSLLKSVRLYAQKETKGDFFPQSWKEGLRFNIGGGGPARSQPSQGYVHNGNPEMRYGLQLKEIEPSRENLKLAALGSDDYEYLAYAPKANLVYEVGEVYPEGYARSYPVSIESGPAPKPTFWQTLPSLPEHKFSGRMAPRGLPGPGSPLPPQSLFLDQSQGYYQLEAQLTGNLKQENVLHRFRMPVYGKMNYRQERNKDWQFTKSTFENLYSNDNGYAVHLERYHMEKRYQLAFHFHKLINHFELHAHLPDAALEKDNFWRQHRWETRFDFHF
ncbi:MAG TPA: hypothetical protein VFO10_30720 [Oligoflexus sp.]|uniref:hypothetical protein n=1 Tax=Oligoflexus sp. TaxID=1971216 RepID=UPI002D7E865A|nr:hypothetical protein [Oligoflexus sp.]HET9241681.1 hypothetical protein [Oligoflexus sp.]